MSFSLRTAAAAAALLLGLAACSDPPPPAEEPTGGDLERAWRIAVGPDLLDQTIAQIYTMALNSREVPTVVTEQDDSAAELAAAMAAEPPAPQQSEDDGDAADPEADEDDSEDERYEIVLARTMPLAQALDAEGYEELTAPDSGGVGPAAAPQELTELIGEQLSDAVLADPTEAVMRQSLLITAATAERLDIDADTELTFEEFGPACDELAIGVLAELPQPAGQLEARYGCEPEELVEADEGTLMDQLITGQIDAAVMTSSHPGVEQNALISAEDSARAFPQDQYAPVVSSRIYDELPGVVEEISAALDHEALVSLRRLIHGDQGLAPTEAAEYWLVQEDFVAEPEEWD